MIIVVITIITDISVVVVRSRCRCRCCCIVVEKHIYWLCCCFVVDTLVPSASNELQQLLCCPQIRGKFEKQKQKKKN